MKYLGIDYGEKRIGLAISDEEGVFAFPHKTIQNSESILKDVKEVCEQESVGEIVLGIPVSLSGGYSAQAKTVQRFGDELGVATNIPIEYENEVFTTKIAKTDSGAAALILQIWLDRKLDK